MKTRLMLIMALTTVLMTTIVEAREVAPERKVAMVEVTEYKNGRQISYSYDPKVPDVLLFPVDPSRVYVDSNGVSHNIDVEGDERGPANFRKYACMLFWLLPFALIGFIPAFSEKTVFFNNAREVAFNCAWTVGLWLFLIIFPTPIKDIGVILFWILTVVLIMINVAQSFKANPNSPILAFIIGMGKVPAAVLGVFFMVICAFGSGAGRLTGESDTAFAVRDMSAQFRGYVKAAALFMVLGKLINGDRVRARRQGYNHYSGGYEWKTI